ncbi:MAG: polyprenyl synthetase family protein [Candidatus Paracaedibacteraceae bacterium]|nr:polyprenyl synthetase family protein [Candidatus Paracaedibacteraceae bacterium]
MKSVIDPLTQLHTLLNANMKTLNGVLLTCLKSEVSLVSKVTEHLVKAGGKRIRPMLTLASQRLFGELKQDSLYLGVAVELIHTATLLHDDVVDNSNLRRGLETANILWGNSMSVLAGDFLFSRAFQSMVAAETKGVMKVMADALALIAEGEVLQLAQSQQINLDYDTYLRIAESKTAVLFDAACKVGGMIAGASVDQCQLLSSYGRNLGLAFQITDDIFDYFPSDNYGKKPGEDFFEGKVTLPIIVALKTLVDTKWLKSLFEPNAIRTQADFKRVCTLFAGGGVFDACVDLAFSFAKVAREAVAVLPPSPIRNVMEQIPNYVVARVVEHCMAVPFSAQA